MRFASWLFAGLAALSFAAWGVLVGVIGDKTNPPWSVIFPDWLTASCLMAAGTFGGVLVVLRIVAFRMGQKTASPERTTSKTSPSGASLTVAGLTRGDLMDATWNMRTGAYRVRWRSNRQEVGVLEPSASGFNVEHDIDGYVGWAADVRSGITMLEEHERIAFTLKPGIGKTWLLRPTHKGDFLIRDVVAYDAHGRTKTNNGMLTGQTIDDTASGWAVGSELESGDLLDLYWSEGPRDFSTGVKIVSGATEYHLPRENSAH